MTALGTLGAGILAFAGPSGAEVAAVGGGAFGASVSVSVSAGPPTTSAPLPAVTLPSSGGDFTDSAPSVTVGSEEPSAPFGGRFLGTGALTADTEGTTGSSGASTSSASVAEVDALGGILATRELSSTCTTSETGSSAATTVTEGALVVSSAEAVTLPAEPAPNTTFTGTDAASGESFTVVLNEQVVASGSISVNAVHVTLNGPTASGDIVLAQSVCAMTAAPPTEPATEPSSSAEPSTSETPKAEPPAMSAAASAAAPDAPAEPSTRPAPAASTSAPEASREDQLMAAAAAVPSMRTNLAAVSQVSGGAYGFYTKVSLFGGAAGTRGPEPTVELPGTGADQPVTATKPTGEAAFGPATLFKSGPLSVSTQGKTGDAGSVTSSASVKGLADRSKQPGPLLYDELRSTCTAAESGTTGSSTISGGVLETKYNPDTQEPTETVAVPANPAPNTERTGTLDHVGDSFRFVFNEQVKNADGSLTVNAAHMYLLGPTAVGDLIIGQSRCGITGASASSSTSSTSSPTNSAGTAVAGTTSSSGSRSSVSSTAGAPAVVAGTRTASSPASATGAPLASTGGVERPFFLGLALVLVGLMMYHSSRRPPVAKAGHPRNGRI